MRLLPTFFLTWATSGGYAMDATATAAVADPPPSTLLRRAALELEDRLKRCKANEVDLMSRVHKCEDNTELTEMKERTQRETQIAKRLQELLDKKDEEFSKRRINIQQQHDELVAQLEQRIDKLTEDFAKRGQKLSNEGASLLADSDFLKDQLREERKRTLELTQQAEDLAKVSSICEGLKTKAEAEALEVQTLREQVRSLSKDHDNLMELQETVESRDREIENLKTRLATQRDPAFISVIAKSAKRLSDPNSLNGLVAFKNKTLAVFATRGGGKGRSRSSLMTDADHMNEVGEAQSSSSLSMRGSSGGGGDDDDDAQPGLFIWSVVAILVLLSAYMFRNVSLTNMTLCMTTTAQIICLLLFGIGFALGEETLHALRGLSHVTHDLFLALLFVCFMLYSFVSFFFLVRRTCILTRAGTTLGYSRIALLLSYLGVLFCGLDFYFEYWAPSFLDNWKVAEMDSHLWLTYFGLFSVQFWVVMKARRATMVVDDGGGKLRSSGKRISGDVVKIRDEENTGRRRRRNEGDDNSRDDDDDDDSESGEKEPKDD